MPERIHPGLLSRARKTDISILLPEMENPMIRKAFRWLTDNGVHVVTLDGYSRQKHDYLALLHDKPFARNWPEEQLNRYLEDPVNMAAAMVAQGSADGLVCGISAHRDELLRRMIRIIGIRNEFNFVFGSTFLKAPDSSREITFADCSIVAEPKPEELAVIAGHSARWHQWITGEKVRLAFISFSTKGDIQHYRVNRVRDAMKIFLRKFPEIEFDGELQVDAALKPEIARLKSGDVPMDVPANVLIFPNMDAGNSACKIAAEMGGYQVMGPVIHGLQAPVGIVSRGSQPEDVIHTVLVTALEKERNANL